MVRPNELSFARRGALMKWQARRRARPDYLTARFVEIDPSDDNRVIVSFNEALISVPSGGPLPLVPGTLVRVAVDSNNSPTYVVGASTTWPEGLDSTSAQPGAVTTMSVLSPAELTLDQVQALQEQVSTVQETLEGFVAVLEAEQGVPSDPVEEI